MPISCERPKIESQYGSRPMIGSNCATSQSPYLLSTPNQITPLKTQSTELHSDQPVSAFIEEPLLLVHN